MARAATREARLIVSSSELGLRHAADLTHSSTGARAGEPVDLFPAARLVSLRHEVISYAASTVLAALNLAAILFFIVPEAMRG
jgi:hypothetical protein